MLGLGLGVDTGSVLGIETVANTKSIIFDTDDEYIVLDSLVSIAGDWTVSSWIKPLQNNYRGIIGSKANNQTVR